MRTINPKMKEDPALFCFCLFSFGQAYLCHSCLVVYLNWLLCLCATLFILWLSFIYLGLLFCRFVLFLTRSGLVEVLLSPPKHLMKLVIKMTHNKSWKVINWNVRGLNSEKKWNSIRDKIVESRSDVICLQETKKEFFDASFIRNFCPPQFDSFEFLPSIGASGGILVAWKSTAFLGQLVFSNNYAVSIEFTSRFNNESWVLTTIYAPCTPNGKRDFLS